MPWYEPSSSAPRYRGAPRRRAVNEEEVEWTDNNNNGGRQNTNNNNHAAEQTNTNIISLQDYLDVHWLATNHDDENINNNNDSAPAATTAMAIQQSQINFDPLQYRVEHQLGAAIFPTVAASSSASLNFAPLNSSLYQTNHFNNYTNNNNIHHGNSTNMNGGNDRISTTAVALPSISSKTAQFFHPRKVMALCQYEGFFSPMDANYNNNNGGQEGVNGIMMEGCNNEKDSGNGAMNEFDLSNQRHPAVRNDSLDDNNHGIQIQPRNLFVAGHGSDNSSGSNHYIGNDNHYNAAAANDHYNSSFLKKDKVPSIQATLRQDPRTGQLATSLYDGRRNNNSSSNNSNNSRGNLMGGKASSWENYGGRPLMDENVNGREGEVDEAQNEKKNKKKKKSKKKSRDDDDGGGGEKNEQQRIDSMFQRKSTGADDDTDTKSDDYGGGGAKKKKSNKTKKKKRSFIDASCELTIPTASQVDDNNNNNITSSTKSTKKAKLTEQDFEGMTNTMNAAQCMEGLQQFLSRVGQESYVAWTMIFLDPLCHYRQYATDTSSSSNGNNKRRKRSKKFSLGDNTESPTILECTTPFLPSNKRYCTDKGPTCTAWNCTCDDQIRAMRGGAPLLGAMFVLTKRDEDDEGGVEIEGGSGGGGEKKECYLLPLGPTEKCLEDLEVGYSRMKSWPVIPFDCEVSLSDRWR